jgi:hypothetical protein
MITTAPRNTDLSAHERLTFINNMVEASRRWGMAMDAKAGFLSTLNAGLLGFIWLGSKLIDAGGTVALLGVVATLFAMTSLLLTLWTVLPRDTLQRFMALFLAKARKPIQSNGFGFYADVANRFPTGQLDAFLDLAKNLQPSDFEQDLLTQHYFICQVVQKKSMWIGRAGWFLILALSVTAIGMIERVV